MVGRSSERCRTRWVIGLALLGAALLAGCMGGSEDAALNETAIEDPQANLTADDEASPQTGEETRLGFQGPDDVTSFSESGSFGAADGAFVGGFLRGADTREHDLTPEIALQTPVSVNVTINYSGETSQLNAYWLFEDVRVFDQHYVKNFNTNTIWMEALVARPSNAGSIVAVVQADTAGEAPEREYTLDVRIRSHGAATLPSVPTSVPVTEASEGFTLTAEGDGGLGEVLVWGPEDGFQRLAPQAGTASLTLGEEEPTGRYIVLARPAQEPDTVPATSIAMRPANGTDAPSQPLQIPGMQLVVGDWHEVRPGEPANWTFEQDSPPLQAGMQLRPATAGGVSGGPDGGVQVALSSPAGTVVEGSGGFLLITDATLTWLSPVGHEALVPGTYEAEASASLSTSYEARHVVVELTG